MELIEGCVVSAIHPPVLTARHSPTTPPPSRPTASEQQMKSTHVIYRQRFLLKNNCGDRSWAQGSMAMDFSVVGSCIVEHNERWGGGGGGWGTAAVFPMERKCLTMSSVTSHQVSNTRIRKGFGLRQRPVGTVNEKWEPTWSQDNMRRFEQVALHDKYHYPEFLSQHHSLVLT